MKKKALICSILLSLGIMATAAASNTDNLKQQYADGNFYIEYQMVKQKANEGVIIRSQQQGINDPFGRLDKFIFAQKGNNQYYQRNDFVQPYNEKTYMSKKYIKEWLDNYRECIMSNIQYAPVSKYPTVYDMEYATKKVTSNDINVVKNGKIYALNRLDMTGYWTTSEEIAANPKLQQLLCINMIIPTIFNSILFNEKNMITNFEGEEVKHELSKDLLCETYTAQQRNEYGSPVGEKWYFQLFYKDGNLYGFSDALSESYYKKLTNKHEQFLNRVNKLATVTDDSIFDVMNDYQLQKFEVQ